MNFLGKFSMLLFMMMVAFSGMAKPSLDRVDPPFWWAGMKNQQLQLMVQGDQIAEFTPQISYPGVVIEQVIHVISPNYVFINLHLDEDVKPGSFDILFKEKGKVKFQYSYELMEREQGSAVREGFNPSDVMYLITPDRFVNGNPSNDNVGGLREKADRAFKGGRHGGDIKGIANSLDYIYDMGFTAIWVNPVLENDMEEYSYHGYSTTDFYKVDPRYGSNEEYRELALMAKEKGVKLIMDMIVNHIGSFHPWMEDMPTEDWINNGGQFLQTSHRREANVDPYVSQYDDFHNADGWFVETMPDLNQRNPLMATYLIQNTIWWVEYGHLAGIRMDTWPYPDKHFMAEWSRAVMEEYPNFNIVGEEWSTEPAIVSYWQDGQVNHDGYHCPLPSLMDFPMQSAMVEGVKKPTTSWPQEGLNTLYKTLAMDYLYPDAGNLVTFLDNHDMSRVFTQLNEDYNAYKRALAFLTVMRGIPQVYYGTEILMGNSGTEDHGIIRTDFPGGWEGDAVNAFTGAGLSSQQKDAQDLMKRLMNWRKYNEVVHKGGSMHFAPIYDKKIYTYCRYTDDKVVMLILNNESESQEAELKVYQELLTGARSAKEVLSGAGMDLAAKSWSVPAQGFLLLEIAK